MLSQLQRMHLRTAELLALAVSHAQVVGTPWSEIARGLGVSEEVARRRFEGRPPTP
jgi:DNA-binding Lrp family transcriptional regulator